METVAQKEMIMDERSCNKIVVKNIILLLMGQLVSLFGNSVYSFAMGMYILERTGSGLSFSLTIALGTLPRVIFGPIAGVVADRVDRKKMVVLLDILSGMVVLSLYVLSIFYELELIYIYVVSFLLATCNTFFETPLAASIPNLVDKKRLTGVNSLSQAILSISTIAGPLIGGLVFALIDIKLFLLINSLSFIFSGISEVFIDFKATEKIYGIAKKSNKDNDKNNFLGDLRQGVEYIMSQRWLVILGSFAVVFNMFHIMATSVSVPYIVVNVWGFTPKELGIVNMTYPLGMLIGSLILYSLPEAKSNYKRLIRGIFISSIGMAFIGILACDKIGTLDNKLYLIGIVIIYFIIAISSISFNIPLNVSLQKHVPNEMLGRVRSVILTFVMGLAPLGAVIGGALLDIVDPWLLPMVSGVLMVIATLILARIKALKSI